MSQSPQGTLLVGTSRRPRAASQHRSIHPYPTHQRGAPRLWWHVHPFQSQWQAKRKKKAALPNPPCPKNLSPPGSPHHSPLALPQGKSKWAALLRSCFLHQNPGIFFHYFKTWKRYQTLIDSNSTKHIKNTVKFTLSSIMFSCFSMCPHCCLSPDIPTASASCAAQVTQHWRRGLRENTTTWSLPSATLLAIVPVTPSAHTLTLIYHCSVTHWSQGVGVPSTPLRKHSWPC